MSVKITGFDNFEKELKRIQKAAEKLDGKHSVSFAELFTTEFMQQYTPYESLEELFSAGGFEVNSKEDLEAIPDEKMDAHVAQTTTFDSWEDMQPGAIKNYTAKKLGF